MVEWRVTCCTITALATPVGNPLLGQPDAVRGGGPAGIAKNGILAPLKSEFFGQFAEGKLGGYLRLGLRATTMAVASMSFLWSPESLMASIQVS